MDFHSRFESTADPLIRAGQLAKKGDCDSCMALLTMIGNGGDLEGSGKLIPFLETALRRNSSPSDALVTRLNEILKGDSASFELQRVVAYALHRSFQRPVPAAFREQVERDALFWLLAKAGSRGHTARKGALSLVVAILALLAVGGLASLGSLTGANRATELAAPTEASTNSAQGRPGTADFP
jgi:hypothetical protein